MAPGGKEPPRRIQIQDVWPLVDCGRYPAKRSKGDAVQAWATIFRDGHDVLRASVKARPAGERRWVQEAPLVQIDSRPALVLSSGEADRAQRRLQIDHGERTQLRRVTGGQAAPAMTGMPPLTFNQVEDLPLSAERLRQNRLDPCVQRRPLGSGQNAPRRRPLTLAGPCLAGLCGLRADVKL